MIVDQIDSIRIKHTTTHLYLEDSPECFTVEALDAEGNTFSSVEGLAFEWGIMNDHILLDDSSRNVLRISKFIDSEYEVSESIRQLESVGLSGHKILIEGLKTGTASVQTKLIDPFYKELKTPLVRLLVVANILLEPSYPVHILQGATIKYNVYLIKQTSIEKINLPSQQYYFESRNTSIANLLDSDQSGSILVGIEIGSTEIQLVDRNMREDIFNIHNNNKELILPPPTAQLSVVSAAFLSFSLKNLRGGSGSSTSWILEVSRTYEIEIKVFSTEREQIFSSDNLLLESIFDTSKFHIDYQSNNGSYYVLTVIDKGLTKAQATLKGTLKPNGDLNPAKLQARGEQDIELLDPIDLTPKIVIFALNNANPQSSYEYQLNASGGSGSYYWQSKNTSVANINSHGLVKSIGSRLGKTEILVTDARNSEIRARSFVHVLEPVDLSLIACPVETQLGQKLLINIQMNALLKQNDQKEAAQFMPISDCSRLKFDISVQDESVFRVVSVQSPELNTKNGLDSCASIVLESLKVGRTFIRVAYDQNQYLSQNLSSNDMQIGSYSPLKSFKNQIVLTKDASLVLTLFGGPLLLSLHSDQFSSSINSNNFLSEAVSENQNQVEVMPLEIDHHQRNFYAQYRVKCLDLTDYNEFLSVKFLISNRKSTLNKCPVKFVHEIKVRCSRPAHLELTQLFVKNDEQTYSLYNNLKWKCPIKLSSNLIVANLDRQLNVQVQVRDEKMFLFDNFTSHHLEWSVENRNLIDLASHKPKIKTLSVINSGQNDNSLTLLPKSTIDLENQFNSFIVYYQPFNTKFKLGDTKLSGKLFLGPSNDGKFLSQTLNIHFVSDARLEPAQLTVFNHPSNVINLGIVRGSGYFHAELDSPQNSENLLKINQITENGVFVAPTSQKNGLVNLNLYDYCVPPANLLAGHDDSSSSREKIVFNWSPVSISKIQVAGINSILVNFEDDKLEINSKLRVYVQISDANGNLINKKYFSLMNLSAKIQSNSNNNNQKQQNDYLLAKISEATSADLVLIEDSDDEFTAVYVLNALNGPGTVSIHFEANADGYLDNSINNNNNNNNNKQSLIKSQPKDVQIFTPLRIQPKYIELIRDAYYQITITGGPINAPDVYLKYELQDNKNKDLIKVDLGLGLVRALNRLGETRISVKSVGKACPRHKCETNDNLVEKVYSEDYFIVRVVELTSLNIQTPLRSIKKGNEMPIYLLANEKTLTPLSFASSPHLKYSWKVNDNQIGTLQHPLLHRAKNEDLTTESDEDIANVLENSFSLRFVARQAGLVRISVRVEFQNKVLTDSLDIMVFDAAHFTHNSVNTPRFLPLTCHDMPKNQILMTPGTEFQIKTNFDKVATRLTYKLEHFSNDLCNNNTIKVSNTGLISVEKTRQVKECVATLLVTVYTTEPTLLNDDTKHQASSSSSSSTTSSITKQQTLTYILKVKPISYVMIKLKQSNIKQKIDRKKFIKQKLTLDEPDIKLRFQVRFYDSLGDSFDLVNTNNLYTINRNDLTSFTSLNPNLFSFTQILASFNSNNNEERKAFIKKSQFIELSQVWNLNSNHDLQFGLKTNRNNGQAGRFIMEFTSASALNLIESRDYLALNVDKIDESQNADSLSSYHSKLTINLGDFLCLNGNSEEGLYDEDEDQNTEGKNKYNWLSQSSNVVKIFPILSNSESPYSHLALGLNEGASMVKKVMNSGDSTAVKIIEIDVRPLERVKFSHAKSFKFISNVHENETLQFQVEPPVVSMKNIQENCSLENNLQFLVPFKCMASLYTKSGHRLAYLDRLIQTSIKYNQKIKHWSCEIKFLPNSNSLLYQFIESNLDPNNFSLEGFSDSNEPSSIKIAVDKRLNDEYAEELLATSSSNPNLVTQMQFLPSFNIKSKLIELVVLHRTQIARKDSKNFILSIQATQALKSHLTFTTNCPTLIQIKQIDEKKSSLLNVNYEIVTNEEDVFDLNAFSQLMEQNEGQLYVQVLCSLTQQVERIPIKFLFGMSGETARLIQQQSRTSRASSNSFLNYLFDFYPTNNNNQLTTFLLPVVLVLITIWCVLKIKNQSRTEKIAMNASFAAAAAAHMAANQLNNSRLSPTKDYGSFNPYRYFASGVDRSASIVEYSPTTTSNRQRTISTGSQSGVGGGFSPQKSPSQVRLFSTDANVSNLGYASSNFDPNITNYPYSRFKREPQAYRSFHGGMDSFGDD